ncbi:MAG TPA: DUF3892 domain-containing protein [Thermoanaerobaculia bacterium]|nr:DUF3892 domain-containing protein [Thermoanaerobaculia bacterium]
MEPTIIPLAPPSAGRSVIMASGRGVVPRGGGGDVPKGGGGAGSDTGVAATTFSVPGDPPAGSTAVPVKGSVIPHVSLQILFWGAEWAQPSTTPSTTSVMTAVDQILASQYLFGLEQYGVLSAVLAGPGGVAISDEPPNPFLDSDIGSFIWRVIGATDNNLPEPTMGGPNLYMVFLPQGVLPVNIKNIGEHTFAHGGDNENVWFGWIKNDGNLQNIMTTFSHELVEAATDPEGSGFQMTPPNSTNWNEIGDACQNSVGPLDGVAGALQVQAYYSNGNHACIIPSAALLAEITTPGLAPGDYQITSVTRSSHNGKPFIFAVSGNDGGTPWILGDYTAMGKILSGDYTFYTNEDGERADVRVVTSPNGHFHLQTEADDTRLNNLSSLPETPASVYSDPLTFIEI